MKILVVNGPNLGILGRREPAIYGNRTLDDVAAMLRQAAPENVELEFFQSNHEGAIVDRLNALLDEPEVAGIIINPAAYSHTSIAILDALRAAGRPAVEVHLSRIGEREPFRRHSMTQAACIETISGHGAAGYQMALEVLLRYLNGSPVPPEPTTIPTKGER